MWAWAFGFAAVAALISLLVFGWWALYSSVPLLAALLAFPLGLFVGMVLRIGRLERELRDTSSFLLERIRALEKRIKDQASPETAALAAEPVSVQEPAPISEPEPVPPEAPATSPAPDPPPPPAAVTGEPEPEGSQAWPAPFASPGERLWRWVVAMLTGENAVVRLGLGVTFVGLAFLYGYGLERRWIGVEWNYILAAAGGLAMLLWGWRLREARPGYALLVQGGGIAVLYSAVFAATRLHRFLPAGSAFTLMVTLVALATALAVLQNAPALATAGALGGYLVPLLLWGSGSGGGHVFLFAYYTVLNAAGAALLLLRGWYAPLLIGFVFSTATALLWGVERYRPAYYWSAQLFLILYFVTFVSAAATRMYYEKIREPRPADLFLLFATPLAGFAMQVVLARPFPLGPALSALAVAAYFVFMARWLWRGGAQVTSESSLTLAVGFLTLAIPLATSLRVSVLVWAVEGAALIWLSLRQRWLLPLLAGLLLLAGVNLAFFRELLGSVYVLGRGDPLAWLSELLLALTLAFGAWSVHVHADILPGRLRELRRGLSLLALFWWLAAGARSIVAVHLPLEGFHAWLAWAAASLGLAVELGRALGWGELVGAFYALPLLAWPAAAYVLAVPDHPFGLREAWLWIPVLVLWFYELHAMGGRRGRLLRPWGVTLGFLFALALVTLEAAWWVGRLAGWGLWRELALAWVPLLVLVVFSSPAILQRWKGLAGLRPLALPLVAAWVALWLGWTSLYADGDPRPLPYLPLLNPLELTQLLAIGALALWWLRSGAEVFGDFRRYAGWALGLALFAWANTAIARAVHHLGGVPFVWSALFASHWFHAALSIFWGVSGLVLMVAGSRFGRRVLWQTGLGLYGLTVVKLFIIDLSDRATVARIISFLGVGLLLVITGYFAPRPSDEGRTGD